MYVRSVSLRSSSDNITFSNPRLQKKTAFYCCFCLCVSVCVCVCTRLCCLFLFNKNACSTLKNKPHTHTSEGVMRNWSYRGVWWECLQRVAMMSHCQRPFIHLGYRHITEISAFFFPLVFVHSFFFPSNTYATHTVAFLCPFGRLVKISLGWYGPKRDWYGASRSAVSTIR